MATAIQNNNNDDLKSEETVDQAVRRVARSLNMSTTSMLDARLLAMQVLGVDEAGLILAGPHRISPDHVVALNAMAARRRKGEPIAHILERKEFLGHSFFLKPGVLTPRPDSETLIEAAMAARDRSTPLRILDLGVGSGCLLISLLKYFPNAIGIGVDRNQTAIETTRYNATTLGVHERVSLVVGDWVNAIDVDVDLIISNPPYIKESDSASLTPDIRDYEDPGALFGGSDGLAAYHEILREAPNHLAKAGLMILELGVGQEPAVSTLARQAFPEATIWVKNDLCGIARALVIDCTLL